VGNFQAALLGKIQPALTSVITEADRSVTTFLLPDEY
jgi:hypothetical protein